MLDSLQHPSKNALNISLLIAVLIFLGLLFNDTLYQTGRICWEVEDYSHGLILPFISLYFLWGKREQIVNSSVANFSFIGLTLSILGLVIFSLGTVSNLLFATWFSFFPTVIGMSFLIFGAEAGKQIAMPLLLMFMAKPMPDALVPKLFFPLQVIAAKLSAWVLDLLGVPVFLKGNIIEIPGLSLMVEEACSGMRSVMALLTVSVIVLYSTRVSNILKATIVGLSIIVAIALNMLRVAATGILAHFYDKSAAEGFFHGFSGLVTFILGLTIIYYIANLLSKFSNQEF